MKTTGIEAIESKGKKNVFYSYSNSRPNAKILKADSVSLKRIKRAN